MNAQQLYKLTLNNTAAGYDPVDAWYCGKCGRIAYDKTGAEKCCVPRTCDTCKQPCDMRECNDCFNKRAAAQELARFEKADKVSTFDGWVYTDTGYGYQEGYFRSVDELFDWLAEHELALDYVWTCKATQFVSVDTDTIYENIEDNGYEDFERADLLGTTELEAAIAVFEKANEGIVSYEPDYTTALVLSEVNHANR